jgi:hypothetical protein
MQITETYVENRLSAWAYWALKNRDALGYPSTSPEYRIKSGGRSSAQSKLPINPDAEEMEYIINQLNKLFPDKIKLLRDYYLDRAPDERIMDIIGRHNVTYRGLYKELKSTRQLMMVYLLAKSNHKIIEHKRVANY